MRSIQRRFNKIQQLHPFWSSHTNFAEAIGGNRFTPKSIRYWFNRLIEKDDYDQSSKKEVLASLYTLSNLPRKARIKGKFAIRASQVNNHII